jgi:TRAP-type uncharacterized transport system substrate-binding protein
MSPDRKQSLLVVLVLAVVAGLLWMAVAALRPMPERSFVMATGPEGSAYRAFAELYRAALAKQGVTLRLVPTNGSYDNVARLRDPNSGIAAAFVQSGTTTDSESPELLSLGTMFYEPLWVFCRCEPQGLAFHESLGHHISIGPPGSATRELALRLMKLNGLDPSTLNIEAYSPEQAAEALQAGRVDTAIIDTAWESPAVQMLLADPSINLVGFPRADAYVARLPFLNKLVLPMGVADLARNRPAQDVTLIAPKTSLVVREDLHPALQYLLIDAAAKIHARPDVLQTEGEFPAPEQIDLPLSKEAEHMYRNGPNILRRHLPFWLAELVQRLLLFGIPLLGLLYPVTTLAPQVWRWEMGRRLQRMYRELQLLEKDLRNSPDGPRRDDLRARLDALEASTARMKLPDSFAAMSYELKQNIHFVQSRFRK